MKGLIDFDILAYEIGFGSEMGWRAVTGQDIDPPPFDYAADMLENRIAFILSETKADEYCGYLTGKGNFREKLATIRPYKGNRKQEKPFHYYNLRAYMEGIHKAIIINGMEADDAMAIEQMKHMKFKLGGWVYEDKETIICTRDKDLRMVPGLHYGWELGNQPSFGPQFIREIDGYRNFFMQCLTGDKVDNIQGIEKCGPVKALKILQNTSTYLEMFEAVREAYRAFYEGYEEGDRAFLENAQLLWMVRKLDEEGKPVMWRFPDEYISG